MNKFSLTQELVKIANILDSSNMHNEANSLTKIAEEMMDENFDSMVYNPDDEKSDMMDNQADDFDNLIDTLMDAERNGDLNDEDIASIMNILSQESGRSTMQMSYDDDENYMTDEQLDEQFDNDPSEMDDMDLYDDEEEDEDPNSWQNEEDESDLDDMEFESRGRGPQMTYPDLDDDF
jgi:hypothetical protein